MLNFWIICALFLIVALIIILPALLAKKPQADVDRKKINRAVYEKKLTELELDKNNDLIDAEQFESAKADLQHGLLDDIEIQEEKQIKNRNKLVPILVILIVPLAAVLIYLNLENGLQSLSPEFQKQLQAEQGQQLNDMGSVEQAIETLKQKLEKDPSNLDDWLFLGRSLLVSEKFTEAVSAFAKANEITNGADPNVLVSYGEAQGFANDQRFDQNSLNLFAKALQIDPKHERGLWYAGFASYQLEEFNNSVNYWQRLLDTVPVEQEDVKSALLVYLNDAKQKAGIEIASASSKPSEVDGQSTENANSSIVVNATLSDELRGKVSDSDTLFIYARAINGPKMPLALVKMTAGDLPATVTLDDSVSMIPNMALSSMQQVEVIARISKSGQAIMQPGDIFGSVKPIATNSMEKVDVVITELAP